ncbi:tetratricopeptide repeat protein [Dactylosporangium sp. CS-033363]|uniref:tetratricopeptide repeat protein n=1 Tax=Dactylosporangium sp. CS-033363 TaxID=3239935 RepID=UPI003D8F95AB
MTGKPQDQAGSEDGQPDAEAAGEDKPDVEVTGESWESKISPEPGLSGPTPKAGPSRASGSLDRMGDGERRVRAAWARIDEYEGRRATMQMSSSLRNLGRAERAVGLLEAGRERESVAIAVGALVPHLPRYQRSMANYARLLTQS